MKIIIEISKDICKGCGLCATVCPRGLIALDGDTINAKGYHPAAVTDIQACVGCASCARMCPDSAITIERVEG